MIFKNIFFIIIFFSKVLYIVLPVSLVSFKGDRYDLEQ